ncbi:hypothetical protein GGG16DRAFT_60880, partial [Schizophyllum commune]
SLLGLTIEYLDPELWPSVALLPSLEELTLRWTPQVTFGNDPLTENGFYDFEDLEEVDPYDDAEDLTSRDQIQGIAFPALRSLTLPNKEWGSLTLTQFRTVWEMREEPWALEKLVIPRDTLHLHLKYSVRTILRYIKEHIRADTLTHLVVSTLWEWRHGIPGDYNPLSAISELFGFSRLTVLHLCCFWYDSRGDFEPLDEDQTVEFARSFPLLRDLLLMMPFLPTGVGIFGQYCKDLRVLKLDAQFHYNQDGSMELSELAEQFVPPAHQGVALERLVICTYMLHDGEREDLFDYAESVYPNATIEEVREVHEL